jgi:DNA polymerase III subunit epsilon
MECLKGKTLAIVDVETSGTSATESRIIEIGILRIEDGVCVETYRTCINPGRPVSSWILALTGIRQEELDPAPEFEDVAETVARLLDGAIFVAHNARFDYSFIKNEFARVGHRFNAKCLCTVRLSRMLFPRSRKHDLSSIIARYKFDAGARHRAFDDAHVLWQFLQYAHTKKEAQLGPAITELLKGHTLPAFLDTRTIKGLPEAPGVYLFFGEDNEPLYVGKSRNIKTRVLSHFSGGPASSKEAMMGRHIVRVEARETAGELSALLLESSLIKSMSPRYNRMLVRKKEIVIARRHSVRGYASLMLERVPGIVPEEHASVLGVFRSVMQAKEFLSTAASAYELCPKILGTEKGNGPCFSHQIGKCKGACGNLEEPEAYNTRFEKAFYARRIHAWPYKGPIVIEESREGAGSHSFVLDNWCLIGDIKVSEDDVAFHAARPEFDHDSYKIFARYLRNPASARAVRRISRDELRQLVTHEAGEPVIH